MIITAKIASQKRKAKNVRANGPPRRLNEFIFPKSATTKSSGACYLLCVAQITLINSMRRFWREGRMVQIVVFLRRRHSQASFSFFFVFSTQLTVNNC